MLFNNLSRNNMTIDTRALFAQFDDQTFRLSQILDYYHARFPSLPPRKIATFFMLIKVDLQSFEN